MKLFGTILFLLFILLLFKPTLVSSSEKKTCCSITLDTLEQDDNNEEKLTFSFYQPTNSTSKQIIIKKTPHRININTIAFFTKPIQKIITPPPRII